MRLDGLKVVSFESRRAAEMAKLIEAHGGAAIIAPSLREVPIERNAGAVAFGERLLEGHYQILIFLTAVGARALLELLAARFTRERVLEAMRALTVVARGPKTKNYLVQAGIHVTVTASDPGTTRELLQQLQQASAGWSAAGVKVAVQEYGAPNPELVQELRARGAEVDAVSVYRWDLPADLEPLRAAIRAISTGAADLALFTSAIQVQHVLALASRETMLDALRNGLRRVVVVAIGPTTGEALQSHGIDVDIVPEQPRMGIMVHTAAQLAPGILESKRKS